MTHVIRLRNVAVTVVAACSIAALLPMSASAAEPSIGASACLLPEGTKAPMPFGNYSVWSTCETAVLAPGCEPQFAPPFKLEGEFKKGNKFAFDYADIKKNFPKLGIFCLGGAITGYFQATPTSDTGKAVGDFNPKTGASSAPWSITALAHIKSGVNEGDCLYDKISGFVLTTEAKDPGWPSLVGRRFKNNSGVWAANNFTLDPSKPQGGTPAALCMALDQIIRANGKDISHVSFSLGANLEKQG